MKLAILDLGTNTFNLLIRDTSNDKQLLNSKQSVRLGQGGITRKEISDEAFVRGLEALKEYRRILDDNAPDEIYAFATSAVRDASNKGDFITQAFKQYGFNINVIDGDREADLIFQGVSMAVDLSKGANLIMDIGGGSTEFIFTQAGESVWKKSYQIGSSRLLQIIHPSDPIQEGEILEIEQMLERELKDLFEAQLKYKANTLFGSSGSFETLAAMIKATESTDYDPPENGFELEGTQYSAIADKMVKSNLQERLDTPGMIPMRADMIVMAVVLINFVRSRLGINQMRLSNYALKEGVYYSIKESKSRWQKSSL